MVLTKKLQFSVGFKTVANPNVMLTIDSQTDVV